MLKLLLLACGLSASEHKRLVDSDALEKRPMSKWTSDEPPNFLRSRSKSTPCLTGRTREMRGPLIDDHLPSRRSGHAERSGSNEGIYPGASMPPLSFRRPASKPVPIPTFTEPRLPYPKTAMPRSAPRKIVLQPPALAGADAGGDGLKEPRRKPPKDLRDLKTTAQYDLEEWAASKRIELLRAKRDVAVAKLDYALLEQELARRALNVDET